MKKIEKSILFIIIFFSICLFNPAYSQSEDRLEELLDQLKDRDDISRREAIEEIVEIGESAVEKLIVRLGYIDGNTVVSAAEALGRIGDARAVGPLINTFKKRSDYVKSKAAIALGRIGDRRAIKPLISGIEIKYIYYNIEEALSKIGNYLNELEPFLDDERPDIRARAVKLLENVKDEIVIEMLIDAYMDEYSDVRFNALTSLSKTGKINDDRVEELLVSALSDEKSYIRVKAAEILDKFKWVPGNNILETHYFIAKRNWTECEKIGIIAEGPVIERLIDINKDIRMEAAVFLEKIKWEPANDKEKAYYNIAKQNWDQCIRIGKPVIEPLIKMTKKSVYNRRDKIFNKEIIKIFGEIKDKRSIDRLIQFSWNGYFKYDEAIESLAKIGEPAIEPIISAVRNKKNFPTGWGIKVLKKMGEQAKEPMIMALKDENELVRFVAVKVLGEIDNESSLGSLIPMLKDESDEVRKAVVNVLGEIDDGSSIRLLISMLKDESHEVRSAAGYAINKLGWVPPDVNSQAVYFIARQYWDSCITIGETALEPLIDTVKNDKDRNIRWNAVRTLGKIGGDSAVLALIDAMSDTDDWVRRQSIEYLGEIGDVRAIDPVIAVLEDKRFYVRKEAVIALGKIRNKRAIPALVLKLKDWIVNKDAAEVLTKLGWKPGSGRERIFYSIATRDKVKLDRIWDTVEKTLIEDMQSDNYLIRENAFCTFIGLGKENMIDQLIELLNQKGTMEMAEIYVDSSNKKLYNAAKTWIKKNKLHFMGKGVMSTRWVKWGDFNNSPEFSPMRKVMGIH